MFATGSAFLLTSCFPNLDTQESGPEGLSVARTITDSQGRRLNVVIIGRNADTVTFVRESDGARFSVPVTTLSNGDQTFVAGLPMTSPPSDTGNLSDEDFSNASGPLGFAMDRRKEILKNLDRIAEEIPKFSKAPSKVSSLTRERDKLTLELAAVNEEIKLLKSK